MVAPGAALAILGVILIRFGWQRSRPPVVVGWAALSGGLLVLARGDGAWGLAVGGSVAVLTAFLLLAHAAMTAPSGVVAGGREARPRPVPIPPAGAIALRVAVFLVVVPLGLALSMILAWTAQRAALAGGWEEADSTVFALLLGPVVWAGLATWQMTRAGLRPMLVGAGVVALLSLLIYMGVR